MKRAVVDINWITTRGIGSAGSSGKKLSQYGHDIFHLAQDAMTKHTERVLIGG